MAGGLRPRVDHVCRRRSASCRCSSILLVRHRRQRRRRGHRSQPCLVALEQKHSDDVHAGRWIADLGHIMGLPKIDSCLAGTWKPRMVLVYSLQWTAGCHCASAAACFFRAPEHRKSDGPPGGSLGSPMSQLGPAIRPVSGGKRTWMVVALPGKLRLEATRCVPVAIGKRSSRRVSSDGGSEFGESRSPAGSRCGAVCVASSPPRTALVGFP